MAKSRRSPRKTPRSKQYILWCIPLAIISFCAAGIYLLWLDARIQNEFEGKRWTLPARVYASPLELYSGRTLTRPELKQYLAGLGYEPNDRPRRAGQFSEHAGSITLVTRPFSYWTGREASRSVLIEFKGGRVGELRNTADGSRVALIRLEPELIGKIYPSHNEDRILLQADEIPDFLINGLLASEDRRFYQHHGLDFRGMARALFSNLRELKLVQGGSTLTQQLVKNYFLTGERTYWRKLNEMAMAVLLERHYSKREILTAYCNEIYLGQHGARAIHGFGTAAEFYYGRPLNELRKDQLALLVALARGANYYNPREHQARARDRRDLVLDSLHDQGFLELEEADALRSRPLDIVARPDWTSAKYPAFLDLVRRQLLREYSLEDLQEAGLKIFTTLDTTIQQHAGTAAQRQLSVLQRESGQKDTVLEMASVIIRRGTGDVLSIIGGASDKVGDFNRVLDARRPIGSLVKPAIYLAALSAPLQYNLLTEVEDRELTLKLENGQSWKPGNYDRTSHGSVHLYDALRHSYNLAAVRVGLDLGLDKVIATLRRAGINRKLEPFPSLLLGAVELTPLEVAQMYQTIANGGFRSPLNSISAVLDNDDKPLQRYALQVEQSLDPQPVFLVNHALTSVVESGTARSLRAELGVNMPLAGKTGTTNDLRDSWFAGFGDNLLAVVWLGYDDNRPTRYTGATGALRVWAAMMRQSGIMPVQPVAPEGIAWLTLRDNIRGPCPELPRLPYISDHVPNYQYTCYSVEAR